MTNQHATDQRATAILSPDLDDVDAARSWRDSFADVFGVSRGTRAELEAVLPTWRGQRLTGVQDGGRWVATFRSWRGSSTVPGGALTGHDPLDARSVPSELVSTVSVSPTHRRRGLLTALMRDCLDHARATGAVVATLFASESAIYGRYGYGVASEVADLTVAVPQARSWSVASTAAPGRLRLVEDDDLLDVGPDLFEAARLRMPGAVGRNEVGWLRLLERIPAPEADTARPPRLRVVHEGQDGTVDGYARVGLDERWEDGGPAYTATVHDLTALDPRVAAVLWRFVLDLDLVRSVTAEHRSPADLLRHLPVDGRAVRASVRDGHWWRVLDTPALLSTRRWSAPGRLVLQVVDPDGPAGGTWRLDVDEDGHAEVVPTDALPDLTLPVHAVPAVATGVRPLPLLAAAGGLDEHRPGGVALLERLAHVAPVALAGVQGF
ncbi:GNAT family N-acetyltransferase [Aquipuribacter nitratireducens]|uniref:GNAT family N-acetyltransferase n=1 Tax=Aquipuribacter nitratireducens TaxID=650104 RepID=A0ABW0GIN2_9MICO